MAVPVDNARLERWRSLDARHVLDLVADFVKDDTSFQPSKTPHTARVHVSAAGHDWELLLTGPKFWDTRAAKGGGGAVDLAMHLFDLPFKKAVRLLQERGL
jgi:hypothetical protein